MYAFRDTVNLRKQAEYDIETLTERIAANEVLWGPGCRPELRARLAAAEATIASLDRSDKRDAACGYDTERPAFNVVVLTDGGRSHLAWFGDDTNVVCGARIASDLGAERARIGAEVRLYEVLDGTGAGYTARCKRCTAGVRAWWNND